MAGAKTRIATFLSTTAVVVCSLPSCKRKAVCEQGAQAQIVGGTRVTQPAGDEAGKRTVAIGYRAGGMCSGVIVAADAILSAAHCVDGKVPTAVLFGGNALTPSHTRKITTARTEMHPTEDLAVLRFDGGIPEGYVATRMADARTLLPAGAPLLVSGYGVFDPSRRTVFGPLFRSTVPFLEMRSLKGRVKRGTSPYEVVARNPFVMTDGRKGTGVCMGDSGGPAFLRDGGRLVVVALTQGGEGLGRCGNEVNTHTDVRPLRDWIATRVKVDESLFEEPAAMASMVASGARTSADAVPGAAATPTTAPVPEGGDAAMGCE